MAKLTITIETDEPLPVTQELFNILEDVMDNLCAKCIDDGKEYLGEVLENYHICLELC